MLLEWTDSAAHPHDGPHTHTQTGEAATKATRTMNKKKKQKAKREGPPAKLFGASSDGWRQVKHSSGRHQTRKRPSCAGPSALLSSGRPFWKASSAVSFLASAPLICKPRSSHFSSFVIRFAWPLFLSASRLHFPSVAILLHAATLGQQWFNRFLKEIFKHFNLNFTVQLDCSSCPVS